MKSFKQFIAEGSIDDIRRSLEDKAAARVSGKEALRKVKKRVWSKKRYKEMKNDPEWKKKRQEQKNAYRARPETKIKASETHKQWLEDNPERVRKYNKDRLEKYHSDPNKDEVLKKNREKRHSNQDEVRAKDRIYSKRYRDRKKLLSGHKK